ncbi:hypothetical protein IAR55_001809 [Kwoniella newhampshirensis]|uniref:Gfo/Idh/MocA-like oxidoreductase N-terminal domain-containing protein n=1 Tax=Kwoniella newhampshirensis TaxID=1651941 RepID=A0AAW0Z387_9TREE
MAPVQTPVLNVAIVGCGEIAMTTHLPTLLLCSQWYRTVAICDISQEALDHCARKFHVPKTYLDVRTMLSQSPEIDLVMVMNANEYHCDHAILALQAGKHVFVEKPMAICFSEAERLEAAAKAAGKVVFIGYMRRYASAFLRVKELVAAQKSISYVRVRDIIGMNHIFVDQNGTYPKKFTDDIPSSATEERTALSKAQHEEALGVKRAGNPSDMLAWMLLNGLSSHDLSAMRELIGMPSACLSATMNGLFMTALFQYDGFVASYEVGLDMVAKFDASIEIFGADKRITIEYDTPYVKGLAIKAVVLSAKENGDYSEEIIRPTYTDAYSLEYEELYKAITEGAQVKTSVMDAIEDLKIMTMIMEKLP